MTGTAGLERGYRRLLACYPARFRSEHGEELVGVLLAGAREGQRRPGLAESASLLRSGLGMRLRPDASSAARRGWADALAAFSLAGPVLLVATTVLAAPAWSYALGPGRFTTPLGLPGFWIMLGFQVVLAALVLAGLRRAALLMTAVYLLTLCLSLYRSLPFPLWSPREVSLVAISVCIVELAALLGSPGPRRGRDLVHWAHGVVLLLCAVGLASYTAAADSMLDRHHPRLTLLLMVIAIAIIARLARAARLSRHFRLLLAALAWPDALLLASWAFGWRWLYLTDSEWLTLLFAGPVLAAAVALISTVKPRRRQII
jgi:hypothetical protein